MYNNVAEKRVPKSHERMIAKIIGYLQIEYFIEYLIPSSPMCILL